ncbi:MAG: hypothetical protein PQJ45_12990 [Sphaerochaetaceae bacterium]|nr:hypothetical protein [Sphaerochaetaceae bacterium]
MILNISVYAFIVLTALVILFQLCLAAGLPWGAASMGGKFKGKYPKKMRIVAILNSFLLAFFIIIILSRSTFAFSSLFSFSKIAIWFLVAFFVIGTVMNSITPSKIERIWAPVTLLQFITSLIIALN